MTTMLMLMLITRTVPFVRGEASVVPDDVRGRAIHVQIHRWCRTMERVQRAVPRWSTRGPRQSRRVAYGRTASTTDERRPRAFFDRHLCVVTHASIGIITSRSRSRSLLERALEPSLLDVDEHFIVYQRSTNVSNDRDHAQRIDKSSRALHLWQLGHLARASSRTSRM